MTKITESSFWTSGTMIVGILFIVIAAIIGAFKSKKELYYEYAPYTSTRQEVKEHFTDIPCGGSTCSI